MPRYITMPRLLIKANSEDDAAIIMEQMLSTLYSHPNFVDYATEDSHGLIAKETELTRLNRYFSPDQEVVTIGSEINRIFRAEDEEMPSAMFGYDHWLDIRSAFLESISQHDNREVTSLYDTIVGDDDIDDLSVPYQMADHFKTELLRSINDGNRHEIHEFADAFVDSHIDEIRSFMENNLLDRNIDTQKPTHHLDF